MGPYVIVPAPQFGAMRQLDCYSADLQGTRRKLAVEIDLTGVKFMKPVAVVGTVMFIQEMASRSRGVHLKFPRKPQVLRYLLRIGLPEMLDNIGEWVWPHGYPDEGGAGLRPIVKLSLFSTSDDVNEIAEEMAGVFESDPALPANLSTPCHLVFSELGDNVLQHSGGRGYVLAQRYEYKTGPVIDIVVGDCGIGVRKSLWQKSDLRPRLSDDRSALILAMKDGITAVDDKYRGFGLGHVRTELAGPGRRLVLRSGRATASWREGEGARSYEAGSSTGTLAHAMIPC